MINQKDILDIVNIIKPNNSRFGKIRVGSFGDGGYVIDNDLDDIEGVISIGIDKEVSFDQFFAQKGIKVYQYDHSIDYLPETHENFVFRKIAWGSTDNTNSRTLKGMVMENGLMNSSDLILKFDVEGAEWECLQGVDSNTLKQFRIITAEFHGFTSLSNDLLFQTVSNVFTKLTRTHISTHIHPNNCCDLRMVCGVPLPALLEISFLRRDRSSFEPYRGPLPTTLDYPNVPSNHDIVLNPWW